jgi:hypothetical protein
VIGTSCRKKIIPVATPFAPGLNNCSLCSAVKASYAMLFAARLLGGKALSSLMHSEMEQAKEYNKSKSNDKHRYNPVDTNVRRKE